MSPWRADWLEHRRKEKLKQKGYMSELTQCNYCSLQEIRAEAKRRRLRVSILPSRGEMNGLNVYVHPRSVSGSALAELGSASVYWRCWFMEVSRSCVC